MTLDLQPRVVPAEQAPSDDPRVGEVAGPLALQAALDRVELPDRLGVDADPRGEPEAPSVHPAQRDPPLVDGRRRVARHAERPREDVRVAAGDDPERLAGRQPVQHLVDETVAAEGEDRVAGGLSRQLGGVALALGEQGLDGAEALLHDARRAPR